MAQTCNHMRVLRFSVAPIVIPFFATGPLNADLVGHWKFDEGAGEVYADSSPNGNDATPRGGGQRWSTDVPPTGIVNTASLNFDGVGTYVNTPYAGIGGNAPRTVAFWLKGTSAASHGIVAWGNSTTNGTKWHVRLNDNANNGPVGAVRTETQGDFTIATTPLNDGNWHHVASVYPDGGGELGTVLHYVDGVLEAAGGNNGSVQAVNTSTSNDPVTIGRRTQGAAQNYFNGLLDDVRIYDRALSGQEIADLMGATPSTDGLVLYMPFEEGTGDTTADLGSGGNDGTVLGAVASAPVWSTDAPPHLSNSLQFADAGDILTTEYPGVGGSASRSITFWFKTTFVSDNGILAWGNSGANGLKWHARLNSGAADGPVGALRLEIQGGRAVATTPVNDDQWHHAAMVFEEDADPDITDLVFYLDGEVDPISMSTSVPIDTQIAGAGALPVSIGGRFQGAALRGYVGHLADVRIYDSGLTQEEVLAIMTGVAPEPPLQLVISEEGGALSISWESQDEFHYTLRSTDDPAVSLPEDWPVYAGHENVAATAPLNTLTFALPPEPSRYFVVEQIPPPPVVVFSDDFENGPGGWLPGSDGAIGTEWRLGSPSEVGPAAAHSPDNCYGTNLADIYDPNADIWLHSPPIDLTTAEAATLNFYQFVDLEEMFDRGRVAVLDAADNSELGVVIATVDGLTADWELESRRIPAAALGKMIILEFRMTSDEIEHRAGWYIDDVEVTVP